MSNVQNDVALLDQRDDPEQVISLVDLGDAVSETKHYAPVPYVVDNLLHIGWDF